MKTQRQQAFEDAGSIHRLINIRANHLTLPNGRPRFEPSYRRAYEAVKVCRWQQQNLLGRMHQGEVGDGNYGKGQG